jgi:hypothetical protein
MLGCHDFCGHYEWTFEWLRQQGGEALVREYWDEAIHQDSQQHAAKLIHAKGIEGMKEYWGHTLADEGAEYHCAANDAVFRIDMHACPSKGFLLRNGLQQYHDYCDHCMGWIGPLLKQGGWVVDHEHNHCGQCWWELRRAQDRTPPSEPGTLGGSQDVRKRPDWNPSQGTIDVYERANAPDDKTTRRTE